MNICTIIARNYLAQARVLASSFKEFHPDGNCTVLVIDDPSGYIDPAEEQFELLTLYDIDLPDVERMAAFYDIMELSTAVKPWLLRTLLARPEVDSVSYLDPDIQVFGPLTKIEEEAKRHGMVLTPHFTTPLPRDELKPSEEDILLAGVYNLGFIGLAAGKTADQLLDWWSERLESDCINEPAEGYFVDQRWIDLAPSFWPDLFLLRETTYNIAYWNFVTRSLEANGAGYTVDGEPLRFFHFSGYDPRLPRQLSKHQNRVRMTSHPTLIKICDEYGERLKEAGYEEAAAWPYGWERTADGLKIDGTVRGLFRESIEEEEFTDSLFDPAGAAAFRRNLTEPVAGNGDSKIGRFAAQIWEQRDDLRKAYPDIDGADAAGYVQWLHAFGPETGAPQELLTPDAPGGPGAGASAAPTAPAVASPSLEEGVNVVGYLSSERGVGEVARQILAALRSREIAATGIDAPTEPGKIEKELAKVKPAEHPYDYNLICVNADMTPAITAGLGRPFFEGRRTAGLWFWEVSEFPDYWLRSFDEVDEVWVATEHIAGALRSLTEKPVRTVRVPLTPGPVGEMSRAELGLPEGFTFLFVFDYRSVFRRKNPLGLVQAFKDAFEPGAGPSLVIKSICGDEFPAERAELVDAVADRPEIQLLEDNVSVEAKNAMIASCDCYVSLHRSEGLGLTMAEAMYFGRPVIATAYSGNLDFMTEENSFLVPYTAAKIGPHADPYPPEGEWAEPDLEAAAAMMKAAVADPGAAAAKARRAAIDIRHTHSSEAAAASIEARVAEGRTDELIERLTALESPQGDPLRQLIGLGGLPVDPESKQVKDTAKRAYMRLLRPYMNYQNEVNARGADALAELRDQLADALSLDQRLNSRVADLEQRLAEQAAALRDLETRDRTS
ncbi:MAG TPA: glycosyltransferase [Solirubrobacterales bacterium]|jgi:glycosyltransferase involved in cell wall biosynthesis